MLKTHFIRSELIQFMIQESSKYLVWYAEKQFHSFQINSTYAMSKVDQIQFLKGSEEKWKKFDSPYIKILLHIPSL
jgi:hypothetical protein